jgi:S1-C subfamily serine protease
MTVQVDLAALGALSAALSGAVAAASPSLVSVQSHGSVASGFVWKPGLVVTADEALAEEGEVWITMSGGGRVPAHVAGRDPSTDVALLRADTGEAAPCVLTEVLPAVGSLILAVGSHEGLASAALGIVGRAGPAWQSMRGGEIDARLDLDISLPATGEGGLALDAHGKAVGMAVFGPRRRAHVIPAATVTRAAGLLEAHGRMPRGYLGLGLQSVRLAGEPGTGAMVMSVAAGGPGDTAGLHQGDVIVAWNGQPIGSLSALLRGLGPTSVGQSVRLSLRSAGADRHVDLVVGERP